MNTHALTDVGRTRETNEDAVLVDEINGRQLLIVADGMGGHAAGDVASEEATAEIHRVIDKRLTNGDTDSEAILSDAVEAANQRLQRLIEDDASLYGMGTTVVAALIAEAEATIVNVGDSRAYHIGETIEQVTVDQSLVQELVDSGEITKEEAQTHPQRNVVSQALGTNTSVAPDLYEVSVSDTLLLCSDGLSEEVDEIRIAEVVTETSSLESAAERLIKLANKNGGSDNITVALAN